MSSWYINPPTAASVTRTSAAAAATYCLFGRQVPHRRVLRRHRPLVLGRHSGWDGQEFPMVLPVLPTAAETIFSQDPARIRLAASSRHAVCHLRETFSRR